MRLPVVLATLLCCCCCVEARCLPALGPKAVAFLELQQRRGGVLGPASVADNDSGLLEPHHAVLGVCGYDAVARRLLHRHGALVVELVCRERRLHCIQLYEDAEDVLRAGCVYAPPAAKHADQDDDD